MRNTQVIRWTRLIARMMDGKSKTMEDFADIFEGVSRKTALRDLMGLTTVPELEISTYIKGERKTRFWRMDMKFKATSIVNKKKRCSKCKVVKFVVDGFCRNSATYDGYYSFCKVCTNNIQKKWVEKNRDRINAVRRAWWNRNRTRMNKQRREDRKISKDKE